MSSAAALREVFKLEPYYEEERERWVVRGLHWRATCCIDHVSIQWCSWEVHSPTTVTGAARQLRNLIKRAEYICYQESRGNLDVG